MTAISAVSAVSLPTPVNTSLTPASSATGTDGSGFATMLQHGMDSLQQTQATAEDLGTQAATGQLTDPAQYMIASTEAQVTTELTVALRNKAVDAFNEIMRMQA